MFDLLTIIRYHENGFESSDPQPPQLKNSHQIHEREYSIDQRYSYASQLESTSQMPPFSRTANYQNSSKSNIFQKLKNTTKTRGHRVSILSPQTLVLPKSSPNICHLLGQGHNLQKNYRASKYSMYDANSLTTHLCSTYLVSLCRNSHT